jgi:hypothetical protein
MISLSNLNIKNPLKKVTGQIFFLLMLAFSLNSCGTYSFSGGSTGEAKTVSVSLIKNEAPNRNPILSQMLTERLKDKFLRETRLTLTNNDADLSFSGTIIDYSTSPSSIQTGDQAARSRLTIVMRVKFVNALDKEKNFEENFSQFQDFDAKRTLAEVESQLIDDITQKLVQDIFNRAVINW